MNNFINLFLTVIDKHILCAFLTRLDSWFAPCMHLWIPLIYVHISIIRQAVGRGQKVLLITPKKKFTNECPSMNCVKIGTSFLLFLSLYNFPRKIWHVNVNVYFFINIITLLYGQHGCGILPSFKRLVRFFTKRTYSGSSIIDATLIDVKFYNTNYKNR